MVQLYVFNPVRKLRLLSNLLCRGSKRILESFGPASAALNPLKPLSSSSFSVSIQSRPIAKGQLVQDTDYFYSEIDNGLCVFQVGNTLFKVHRILLTREPSAFRDMFSIPQPSDECAGTEAYPITLADSVEQFKDLLWALYAPLTELFSETRIERLLNVLELTNKYCFSSLETWIAEHIYRIACDPKGALRSPSSTLLTRILHLAILSNHQKLQDLMTQNLICRVLWYNARPETVIEVAAQHGLHNLLGVCYYKQLIKLESTSRRYEPSEIPGDSTQTQFPEEMDIETRMRFLSAHESLLRVWDRIRSTPPPFCTDGCPFHDPCECTWQTVWNEALKADEGLCYGSADILGRLKSIMICVRNRLSDATLSMSMPCKLSALESLSFVRDEIIEGMMTHFENAS